MKPSEFRPALVFLFVMFLISIDAYMLGLVAHTVYRIVFYGG